MATPRKRYFRVADSVRNEPWTNDELAFAIRLMGELNTRWARNGLSEEEACSATFGPGDFMALTGCASLVRARRIARGLATHVSLILDERGAYTRIEWRKFAEFQYSDSRSQGNSDPEISPSAAAASSAASSASRTGPPKPPEPASPPPAARARRSRRRAVDPRSQEAWPSIRAAFAEHGTQLGEALGLDRSELIAKRLDDGATPDDLVAAVHGYVRANGLEPRGDFDPRRFFRPQTVFKADGFSDRVDAGRGPRPIGSGVSKAAQNWGLR